MNLAVDCWDAGSQLCCSHDPATNCDSRKHKWWTRFDKSKSSNKKAADSIISHRIHGAGIYANIGGILMVNVTIYIIHESYINVYKTNLQIVL